MLQIKKHVLTALNNVGVGDIQSVEAVTTAMKSVIANPTDVSIDNQKSLSDISNKMVEQLELSLEDSTQEQITSVADNIIQVLSGTFQVSSMELKTL